MDLTTSESLLPGYVHYLFRLGIVRAGRRPVLVSFGHLDRTSNISMALGQRVFVFLQHLYILAGQYRRTHCRTLEVAQAYTGVLVGGDHLQQ